MTRQQAREKAYRIAGGPVTAILHQKTRLNRFTIMVHGGANAPIVHAESWEQALDKLREACAEPKP